MDKAAHNMDSSTLGSKQKSAYWIIYLQSVVSFDRKLCVMNMNERH